MEINSNYNKDDKMSNSIVLEKQQIKHFEQILSILQSRYCYLDFSNMGTGKMVLALAVAKYWNYEIMVVCPGIVRDAWEDKAKEYGVPIVDIPNSGGILSYDKLRSIRGHQPCHGLLIREDIEVKSYDRVGLKEDDTSSIFITKFKYTDQYRDLLKNKKILLILDEVQKVKNDNGQFKAVQALTSGFYEVGTACRFGMLSGTPIDCEYQCINTLRIMGLIFPKGIQCKNSEFIGKNKLEGLSDFIFYCRQINEEETRKTIREHPLDPSHPERLVFELFISVIQPVFMTKLPDQGVGVNLDAKNGYYRIDNQEDRNNLNLAIDRMENRSYFNPKTKTINKRRAKANFGEIKQAHEACELAKANLLVRLADSTLKPGNKIHDQYVDIYRSTSPDGPYPKFKVLIFVSYTETVKRLKERLEDFGHNVLILSGEIEEKYRPNIKHKFQTDPSYRILICNINVGSVGIDLDDQNGDEPRVSYIVPTHSIQDLFQATYRSHRRKTKSPAIIRYVYGDLTTSKIYNNDSLSIHRMNERQKNNTKREMSIINCLAKKSDVIRRVVGTSISEDGSDSERYTIKYPDEYEEYWEAI